MLRNQKLLFCCFLISLTTAFSCLLQVNHDFSVPEKSQIEIFPDEFHFNGGTISFIGHDQNKTKFQAIYFCKNEHELEQWQKMVTPCYLAITGDYEKISPPTNINEFDYARFQRNRGIGYSIKIKSYHFTTKPQKIIEIWHVWRAKINQYFRKLPKYLRFQAQNLVLGYSDAQDQSEKTVLSYLGIIHLFSISGMHVYILVDFIFSLAAILRIEKEKMDWLVMAFLPLYCCLAGGSDGLKRAIILSLINILCQHWNFSFSRLDVFCWVLLINLMINPFLFFEMGGILSYLMALGLIFLKKSSNLVQTIKLNLFSLPILLYFNFRWNILTILLNLIVGPIFLWILVPITFLGILILPFSETIVSGLESILFAFYQLTKLLTKIPHTTITFGKIPLAISVLSIVIAGTLLNTDRKHLKIFGTSLFLIYSGVFLWIHFPIFGQVSFMDIGQGDSILIVLPFHRGTILIDTGGKLGLPRQKWQQSTSSKKLVQTVTINYLYSLGIDKIDMVIVSHQDADHIGDLTTLLETIPVERLVFGRGILKNPSFYRKISQHTEIKWESVIAGDHLNVSGQNLSVVAPDHEGLGENGDSVSIYTQLNHRGWLFTGDLDRDGERKINNQFPDLKIDYLKAGHHGSHTSSDPDFIKFIHPKMIFISAGRNNRYGHPHQDTLEIYRNNGIPFLNTAENGQIIWKYYPNREQLSTVLNKTR